MCAATVPSRCLPGQTRISARRVPTRLAVTPRRFGRNFAPRHQLGFQRSRHGAVSESMHANITAPHTEKEQDVQRFEWIKQWYPVAVLENTDPEIPQRVQLMGKNMALWRSPEGNWSCLDDACSHRAGPLSQGRIDAATGCLTCSYHGWQFRSDGTCADVPQSSRPEHTSGLKRSSVRSYPVRVAQGLLWVWPDNSREGRALAETTPLATCEELDDENWWSWMPWLAREAHVSFDFILENGFDYSHVPFVHHGLTGIKRSQAARGFKVHVDKNDPMWGVQVTSSGPFERPGQSTTSTTTYQAPVCYTARAVNLGSSPVPESLIVIYRTPVRAGVTLSFARFVAKNPNLLVKLLLQAKPAFMFHLDALRFQDGDYVLMHEQERLVEQAGGWKRAFFLPDPTDAGVVAFRRWFDQAGDIPFVGGQKLGPELPRNVVLDHYSQHVVNCKHCKAALQNLKIFQVALIVAGVGAAIAGGYGLAQQALSLVPGVAFLAVGAALLGIAWKVKQYIQDYFFFQDYLHPANA